MYKTTKSPRKVLLVAHAVAVESFQAYAHHFSPKKFTQHQLFAVLVLKEFMRCDYRKLAVLLGECSDLREAIGLESVPHYTTIQKASKRLLKLAWARSLLESTVRLARKKSC
jgi:hypothetical protein